MTSASTGQTWKIARRLLAYVRPYRFVIVPAMIAIVVYALVTGVVPFFMEDVFEQIRDGLVEEAGQSRSILAALRLPLILAVIFALRGVTDFLTIYGLSWVGRSAIRDLRTDLFRHYLYLPASYYDRNQTGNLISRLTFNTEQTAEAISTSVAMLVRDCLLVIVMLMVMLHYSFELTLILAIVGPVIGLLLGAMSRAFRRYSVKIQNSMGDVTRIVGRVLQGHQVVKIFSGQEYESGRFEEINRRNFRLHLRMVAARAVGDFLTQYVVILGIAVIVFLIFSGWLSESVDSPQFIAFITAVGVMLTALKRLVSTNAVIQRGIAAGQSLFDVLDEPAEAAADGGGAERVGGAIEFEDVIFRYEEDGEEVLKHVSFTIEPGETIAIVGRSGSGKSTLVSLLPRFYDASSGVVRLDGRDVRDYPLPALRRQFSFVSQDVVLFDGTIAENIAYGALAGAPREAVEKAAELAYVRHFSDQLPGGLDTEVGEDGARLSGGQRQRIAIARAMLKDAPVLILDEATSALDSESERHVQSALESLMQGRTTLVIAHRLSTVENADRIIVMHDGRITESGTHRELLAAGGHYASLHRLQFAD